MNTRLSRLVALLLVPCLVADHATECSMGTWSPSVNALMAYGHRSLENRREGPATASTYEQEALAAVSRLFPHPGTLNGKPTSQLNRTLSAAASETKEEELRTSLTPRAWLRLARWHFRNQIRELFNSVESPELDVEKIKEDVTVQFQLSEYLVKTRTVLRLDTTNPEDSLLYSTRNHFYMHIHLRLKKNSDNVIILNIPIALDGTLGREILAEGHGASIFMPLEPVAGRAVVDYLLQEATKEVQPYREQLIERMRQQVQNPDLPMIAMGLVLAPTAERWWVMPVVSNFVGQPLTHAWMSTREHRHRILQSSLAFYLPHMYVGDFQQEPTAAQLNGVLKKAPYRWVYGKIGKEYSSKQHELAEILAGELKRSLSAEGAAAAPAATAHQGSRHTRNPRERESA